MVVPEKEKSMTTSDIFREFAEKFINSGDTPETIMAYSAIAITAWNYAKQSPELLKTTIENLEKRLKCKVIEMDGKEFTVHSLVMNQIARKIDAWSEYDFKVNSARFEQEDGVLKVFVN